MNITAIIPSTVYSRRLVLRGLTYSPLGAAVIWMALGGNRVAAVEARITQKEATYQGSPKGEQQCGTCKNFEAPSSCKVVEGSIASSGWCKMYGKKSA